jgi:hypothetical protein
MTMTEKDTSSGHDIREYKCSRCGHDDWEVRGPALWQILSDDRERSEASKASSTPTSASHSQTENPANSIWSRLLALLSRSKKKSSS